MTKTQFIKQLLNYYSPSLRSLQMNLMLQGVSKDHIERDPSVLNEIQCVDFSSPFSEEHSIITKKEVVNESQDSFVFSDDDDILTAAARHNSASPTKIVDKFATMNPMDFANMNQIDFKKTSSETSPFKSVQTLMQSPKKTFVSPKRKKRVASSPVQEAITKLGTSDKSNLFNRLHAIKFDTPPQKEFIPVEPSSVNIKNPFMSSESVINDVNVESAKQNQTDIKLADSSVFQVPQQARAYSTKAAGNPTIHLATQKPMVNHDSMPSGAQLKQVKPIILSKEQEFILQQAVDGTSLFYTGSAGTGKSILLKSIIKALRLKHKDTVAVTASTGLAACNIGGITLHSFAGVGIANEEVNHLLKKLRRNQKAYKRWLTTKVLIIDEISMVDGHLLNKFNDLAKTVRKSKLPFGGIQIIACGDFYQLPPVVKRTKSDGEYWDKPPEAFFSFECEAWKENIEQTYMLKEIFRQKGDQRFIDMLNEMRNGTVSNQSVEEFHRLDRPVKCPVGINPAELFATRTEVDRANNVRLNKLPGNAQVYSAFDDGILPNPQRQGMLQNFLAPQKLFLKKDAQVMCIKNFDETLVNGSLGTVVDFIDRDTYLKAQTTQDSETQLNDSDYIFESSANLSGAIENNAEDKISKAELENKERKKSLAEDIEASSENRKYPLVRFMLPDGVNTRTILIEPEQWKVEDEEMKVLASRTQLPLILAWSLSIHKSQGQTLPRVKVDLRNVFETGQAYVALSRAVSREGLQVCNFDKYKVRSHPKVITFYKKLASLQGIDQRRGQTKLNFSTAQM